MSAERPSLVAETFHWWQHPLVPVAWGILAAAVYALFPSSDTNALVALLGWGAGVLVWMVTSARG